LQPLSTPAATIKAMKTLMYLSPARM
jgi:hypothetical protein